MIITPIRLLQVHVTNVVAEATWTDSSNPSDPFINYPYKWTVTLSVNAQPHSDPSTTTPYFYTGTDIVVGDWFSNAVGGAAWQIVSITSATASTVVVVVQDIDLLNTVSDPTQSGSGGPPSLIQGFIFQIGEDGLPLLSPVPPLVITSQWQTDIIGRFRYRNMTQNHYEVIQIGNTFTSGQLISLTSDGTYVLATSIATAIGVVRDVTVPETGYFTYRPIGPIIKNISPALPGSPGSLIYLDPTTPGGYTATIPSGIQQPIFIQITTSIGILLSRNTSRSDQGATVVLGATTTLNATLHHKHILVCTVASTISLPTPWPAQFSTIGNGFTCDVLNLSGSVITLDTLMTGTTSIPVGALARIVATSYQNTVFVSTGAASSGGTSSGIGIVGPVTATLNESAGSLVFTTPDGYVGTLSGITFKPPPPALPVGVTANSMAVVNVGTDPNFPYSSTVFEVALLAVADGGVINLPAGTYQNWGNGHVDQAIFPSGLTINGAGAYNTIFDGMGGSGAGSATRLTWGKGIIHTNAPLTVNNCGFIRGGSSSVGGGESECGIYGEYNSLVPYTLTVNKCAFDNNQCGLFVPQNNVSGQHAPTIVVNDCEFGKNISNGQSQDGLSHDCYLNGAAVVVTNSRYFGNTWGHNLKSRSASVTTSGNLFVHGGGRCIDISEGTATPWLSTNDIFASLSGANAGTIGYGDESTTNGVAGATVTNATLYISRYQSVIWNNTAGTITFVTPIQYWVELVSGVPPSLVLTTLGMGAVTSGTPATFVGIVAGSPTTLTTYPVLTANPVWTSTAIAGIIQ